MLNLDIPKHWSNIPEYTDEPNSEVEPQMIVCPKCGHEFSVKHG